MDNQQPVGGPGPNPGTTPDPAQGQPQLSENHLRSIQPSDALVQEMKARAHPPVAPVPDPEPPASPIAPVVPIPTPLPTQPVAQVQTISPTQNPQPLPLPQPVPAHPGNSQIGLTGSQLNAQKPGLPIGIYIIVGLLFLGFILGFFSSNTSPTYIIALLINAALGVGLLFRKKIARKIILVFSTILIIFMVIDLIALPLAKNAATQRAKTAQNTLNQLESNLTLTPSNTAQINAAKHDIANDQKILKQAADSAYITDSLVILANAALIVYLTRPKVKAVFE